MFPVQGKLLEIGCVADTNLKSIFEIPHSLHYDSWLSNVGVVDVNNLCLCIVGTDRQTARPDRKHSTISEHPPTVVVSVLLRRSSQPTPQLYTFHNPSQCPKCR